MKKLLLIGLLLIFTSCEVNHDFKANELVLVDNRFNGVVIDRHHMKPNAVLVQWIDTKGEEHTDWIRHELLKRR